MLDVVVSKEDTGKPRQHSNDGMDAAFKESKSLVSTERIALSDAPTKPLFNEVVSTPVPFSLIPLESIAMGPAARVMAKRRFDIILR